MSSASGRVALRALSGRLLGRVSADAPSFSGRTAAAAAPTQAGEAGRLSRGMRFLTGPATPSWALRASPAVLRGRGPVLGRHLASAPDFVPPTVASAAATDQPAAAAAAPATPTPPPSSDRPHPLDYTTLCALAAALRGVALPAKVDEVVQVDSHTACLRVRVAVAPTTTTAANDDEGQPGDDTPLETLWIWLCWHNMGARVTVGPPPPRGGPAEAYGFGRSLQAALVGGVLVQARCPVEYERCMELLFAESASAPADTALVLHANASDNFLALVSVGVRSVADAAAAKKKKTPSALPTKKAPRGSGSSKVVRLPLQPPRLAYGRIMAVSTARPGQRSEQARKRQAGADGLPPRPRFPVPGDKFQRPQPSVRHLVPSPSETLALWRSNIMAADADAMAARAAAAAKDDESDDESGEEEEAPPPPPPLPRSARPPKQPDSAVAACMARTYAGVGRATADEMCVAAGVDPAAPPATLDEDAWAALHSAWTRWLVALGASHYKLGGGLFGRPFSVLGAGAALLQGGPLDDRDPLARAAAAGALAATNDDPTVRLPVMARGDALDLMAAVDTYFRQVKDAVAPTTLEAHVQNGTARALRRARDKAASLATQADRAASADAKAHTADLIMSHVHAILPGATEMTVVDWETSAEVTIPLGDGRTPAPDVAAALYKEARRMRRGAEAVGPLLEAARADVAELEEAAATLAALPALGEDGEAADPASANARAAVLQEVRLALEAKRWLPPWREAGLEVRGAALAKRAAKRTGGVDPSPSLPSAPRFRRFTAPSGLEVLVGRNNKDNDRLSLRVANPGDTWLHARGVPGAHVVLRAPPGGAEGASLPDEADLRFAASIAAFYSKARDGSVVDVSHTPARHVKKPRGAPPGLVTLLQEAVVRVRPDDAAAVAAAAEGGEEDE